MSKYYKMKCDCCYSDYLAKCEDEIIVYAQLQPMADYRWVITDKFGNKYEGEFTTDANGFFAIPVEKLPEGLLTQYSGVFVLEVYDAGCRPVKFKMAGEYDCIQFDVRGGTFQKQTLGCNFACAGTAGAQSAMIPFVNETGVVIDWTNYADTFGNNPTVQVYHEQSPGIYSLVTVDIEQVRSNNNLLSITVDNGAEATGYVIIS